MIRVTRLISVAVLAFGTAAVAQDAVRHATPETPAAEVVKIAQEAIAQDELDAVAYREREAEEFQVIGKILIADLKESAGVEEVVSFYPERNGVRTGMAIRFEYNGLPVWAFLIEKDEYAGLDGRKRISVLAPGRAGVDEAERDLLSLAPAAMHLELDRGVAGELRRRFGCQWEYVKPADSFSGRVDAPFREVEPGVLKRSAAPEAAAILAFCDKVAKKYTDSKTKKDE